MRRGKFSPAELFKWLIIALMVLLFYLATTGCNPVKQVLKSPEKTEQVVVEYVKRNPVKNDTIYIPGDTITTYDVIYDSVKLPYPVNHKYTEIRTVEHTITDTVEIIDRKLLGALEKRVTKLETDLTYWKNLAQKRGLYLIIIIALLLGGGIIYLIKTVQPKITLGK
jgi:hypothetical protein